MRSLKQVLLEVAVVGGVGVAVGFAANSLRGSDSIILSRNYFSKGMPTTARSGSDRPGDTAADRTPEGDQPAHLEHDYQSITFDQVVEVFNDPATAGGANVFVDARKDADFLNGHIPGALQVDHFRLPDYIEPVLDAAQFADKVIVYCTGGQCELSEYVCKDLIDFDVPYEIIYLYEGGWNEWESSGQPIEESE